MSGFIVDELQCGSVFLSPRIYLSNEPKKQITSHSWGTTGSRFLATFLVFGSTSIPLTWQIEAARVEQTAPLLSRFCFGSIFWHQGVFTLFTGRRRSRDGKYDSTCEAQTTGCCEPPTQSVGVIPRAAASHFVGRRITEETNRAVLGTSL